MLLVIHCFSLHLSRLDLLVQEWQDRGDSNTVAQQCNTDDALVQTLDPSLSVSDFCLNEDLAYETCVRYAPLNPVGAVDEGPGKGDIQCAPENSLRRAAGFLSEEASLYLTRTCDNT